MERKFKDGFSNIDEELLWEFARESGLNVYIIGQLVHERNLEREKLGIEQARAQQYRQQKRDL